MDETAKCGCSMYVNTGDEHPDIFTVLTGIQPTSIEVRGENEQLKNGKTIVYKRNVWRLNPVVRVSDNKDSVWNICESILDINRILDEKEVDVRDALRKFSDKEILFYGHIYHYWVQFYVEPQILHEMCKYDIPIRFSILSFQSEDNDG